MTLATAYLREHIAEIEDDLSLDGVIIALYPNDWTGRCPGQEDRYFGGHRSSVDDFRQGIEDLQNTQFSKFKHNFIQFATSARGANDLNATMLKLIVCRTSRVIFWAPSGTRAQHQANQTFVREDWTR